MDTSDRFRVMRAVCFIKRSPIHTVRNAAALNSYLARQSAMSVVHPLSSISSVVEVFTSVYVASEISSALYLDNFTGGALSHHTCSRYAAAGVLQRLREERLVGIVRSWGDIREC